MAVLEELLALLACPRCKGELKKSDDGAALVCPACRLRYPVRDGIPVLLIDEAEGCQAADD